MRGKIISYAQRYEDIHLLRCFGAQSTGFYIDIGAGHPVSGNVTFAFYRRGWRGLCAEPNTKLIALSRAIRPRDENVEMLVGATSGESTYYLVDHLHGFSTTSEINARAALSEYGKEAQALTRPVTTLQALCEHHAPSDIDILKIDVEGAEGEVIAGNDWTRFRPKVIVAEALAPFTQTPAWADWEPTLARNGYRYIFFDSLNRYYVRDDQDELAERLRDAPAAFDDVQQVLHCKGAREDRDHPDHALALILNGADMVDLPFLSGDALLTRLTAGLLPAALQQKAARKDLARVCRALAADPVDIELEDRLALHPEATLRDLYEAVIGTESFRAALGRISASYAW